MKAKLIQVILPILAAALAILGYTLFAGIEDVGFKFDIVYSGDMDALWATLEAFPDGTVVIITFRVSGTEIPYSEKIQLMGGSSASFDIGDRLPLSKSGGVWHEMTRYLTP